MAGLQNSAMDNTSPSLKKEKERKKKIKKNKENLRVQDEVNTCIVKVY